MKTAKQIVLVAIVVCPDCDASIAAPDGTGSYDWTSDTKIPATVVCPDCNVRFRVPNIKFS